MSKPENISKILDRSPSTHENIWSTCTICYYFEKINTDRLS